MSRPNQVWLGLALGAVGACVACAELRDPRLCACYACPKLHVTAHSEEESVAAQHGHNDAVRAMHNIAAILKEFGVEDDDLGLYRE